MVDKIFSLNSVKIMDHIYVSKKDKICNGFVTGINAGSRYVTFKITYVDGAKTKRCKLRLKSKEYFNDPTYVKQYEGKIFAINKSFIDLDMDAEKCVERLTND